VAYQGIETLRDVHTHIVAPLQYILPAERPCKPFPGAIRVTQRGGCMRYPHGIAAIAASIRRANAIGCISLPSNIHWLSTATVRVFGKTNTYWPP